MRMLWRVFTIIVIAGAIPQASVLAQERDNPTEEAVTYLLNLSMEELMDIPIQSSGFFAMERKKTPGHYYLVDKEMMDKYGLRSVSDYLERMVPGLTTAIHGTQGKIIGVRGILIDNNAKTLVLRDNINMNNRKFVGINGAELSTPLIGDIERVEVVLGPGAVQHGSGAINGSVNIVSATGKSKEGLRLNASYGSGESRFAEASYGLVTSDRMNLFFYAGYSKSDGVDPYYTFPKEEWSDLNGVNGIPSDTFLDNVKVGKTDDDYKFSFRGQFGGETDPFSLDLKMLVSHVSNVDPVLGEYLSESATWREEVQRTAEARGGRYSPFYEQHSDNVLVAPEIRLNFNENNRSAISLYYHTIKTTSVFSDFLKDEVQRLGITLRETGTDDCPALSCEDQYESYGDELHLGSTLTHQYSGFEHQQIAFGAEVKFFEFFENPWSWTTVSAFIEDQATLGDFSLTAGARYDKTYFEEEIDSIPPYNTGPYEAPDDVDAFTMRLAVAYRLSPTQTAKLSYQEGFRFADAWFQQWAEHINKANSTDNQMYPEESQSFEANYSALGLADNRLNIYASLFHNTYKNTQGWVAEDFNFGNSPKTFKSIGTEIEVEVYPAKDLELGLSYSYARPIDSYETSIRIANEDDTWTRYPLHMVKFRAGYNVFSGLFIGTTGTYQSARYEKAEVSDPRVEELFNCPSFVMNANAWYMLRENLRISLIAEEILHHDFNQNHAYFSGTRPLDSPRAKDPRYYLSISYNF